ncbi:hypothetical protein HOD61_01230 [archaeon]|jgi:NOL1/NOP2/fmu family ribosome biogenesis protein|nr:hypothetical protein [archaeon]
MKNIRTLTPLKAKEVKKIFKQIDEQFNIGNVELDYYFFISRKDRVYIISRGLGENDLLSLRLSHSGLYFCTIEKDGIRMSIEGSQLIGKYAKQNVITVDDDHRDLWITGSDLHLSEEDLGYVLIKNGSDFYGCGRNVGDKILTYIPKSRRVFI